MFLSWLQGLKPGAVRPRDSRCTSGAPTWAAGFVAWSLASAVGAGTHVQPTLEPCIDADQAQRAVAMLNAWRERGAPCAPADAVRAPLTWAPGLGAGALEHAADLAARGALAHEDRRQRGLTQRLQGVGYHAVAAAEVLAVGQPSFESALQAWLNSPRHCSNLMAPQYNEVGLACVVNQGAQTTWFWVAQLGTPRRR